MFALCYLSSSSYAFVRLDPQINSDVQPDSDDEFVNAVTTSTRNNSISASDDENM